MITVQGDNPTGQGGFFQSQGKSSVCFLELNIFRGVVSEKCDPGLSGLIVYLLALRPVHQHFIHDHRDFPAGVPGFNGSVQSQA